MAPAGLTATTPHVVIVGGGFGGLAAARALKRAPGRITLVDRRNHHLFYPLLYQVATATLSPADIASPIRSTLRRQQNVEVLLDEVTRVDLAARTVHLAGGAPLAYDYLILAAGSRTSYFGHDEWQRYAPGLKSIEDALEVRRRVLLAFEAAERATDPAERQRLLTFVIVGGGPTGVELAGSLAEIARHTLRQEFRRIDPAAAHIDLVDSGPRLLATFPAELSATATHQLERLGVEVRSGAPVTAVTADGVTLKSGEVIRAGTVLWAAGVVAAPLTATLGVETDRTGRIPVNPDLTIPGHPEVYAIGDLALFTHGRRKPVPWVAPAAMQQGRTAGRNIIRQLRGQATQPFRYFNKGDLAIISRTAAVGDWGWLHLSGFPVWLLWLLVHLSYLTGVDNRLIVLVQWLWSFVANARGARLITEPAASRPPVGPARGAEPAAPAGSGN